MKWIEEIVSKILKEYPNEKIYTVSCGLSTTGLSHIGNFRELIIAYFVSEELKRNNKKVRLILSFDDFDRLKKVPYNINKSFQKYIGMPNYSIPGPFDNGEMYAEYFENLVINELNQLGINMEYIKQSKRYLDGTYNENIVFALNNRHSIFDIISKYKTQKMTEIDKLEYYPVKIYCSKCNKDFTTITEYDEKNETICYKCECGNEEKTNVKQAKIKLKFNVDWPMRWNYEHVIFEPCGKGHTELNGVLNVSKEINSKIFGKKSPVIEKYEFLNLKSSEGRMNKNSSNIVTITETLNVMSKEMLLWIFLNISPNKEINFSLDDNIIKLYEKYEDFILSSTEQNKKIKNFLSIRENKIIKFSDLIKYLPIVNFDLKKLNEYVEFDINNKEHLQKIKYAISWLKKYSKNKYWEFNEEKNIEYWNKLTLEEKNIINNFKKVLESSNIKQYEQFINELRKNKEDLSKFYTNFYNLVFGSSKGIPLKTLLKNFDLTKIISLLTIEKQTGNIIIPTSHNKTILHLSDLHFDINDYKTSLNLEAKWDQMINKINAENINYLVITGDIICFYNMTKNYDMAYKFITHLIDELKIDKNNIYICSGNHEHLAFEYERDYKLFTNFESLVKPAIIEYSNFQKNLLGYGIDTLDDLYYIKSDDLCDFFVINSLYSLTSTKQGVFLQDEEKIKQMLSEYTPTDKYRFIITHSPRSYNSTLFEKTPILEKFNINLGGHKHIEQNISVFTKNDNIQLISGNKDGFVEEENSYKLYNLTEESAKVKKLIYKNDNWIIEN